MHNIKAIVPFLKEILHNNDAHGFCFSTFLSAAMKLFHIKTLDIKTKDNIKGELTDFYYKHSRKH